MPERKVTLNLDQRASVDLTTLMSMTGDNMTDVVRKSIRLYKILRQNFMQEDEGYIPLVNREGEKERVYIL